jgi:hypothetical protein
MYGTVKSGVSQIWLQNPDMDTEIVGTISFNPTDDRLLVYEIDPDTLPQNTLDAVDSVINPHTKGPGQGLPAVANGQRYLLVEDITDPTGAWGNFVANANDIIQYNGNTRRWTVSFNSAESTEVEYVRNLTSGIQYRYVNKTWVKSYEGWYEAGDYSIVI